jgi:deoxyribodipyrimidine photo-lyase
MNQSRIFHKSSYPANDSGDFVLYWMQIFRRFEYNEALEFAVKVANDFKKPLVIFEGLKCTYPWASDRFHHFILQGMDENKRIANDNGWNYYSFVEKKPFEGSGLIHALSRKACVVVSDEFPAFVIRDHNEKISQKISVPYITVDANGIIPLGSSAKAPYSAFQFRRLMQKNFLSEFEQAPKRNPMAALKNKSRVELRLNRLRNFTTDRFELSDSPIDHSVSILQIPGTREAALKKLKYFCTKILRDYAENRNHPDRKSTSELSPYLHFGKLSSYEIVKAVLKEQPKNWSLNRIHDVKGRRNGFFNGDASIEAYLDQVITWRETGYHFCHHVKNYDQYESLPKWAVKTLEKHARDKREFVYGLHEFESASTHDAVWNAAQRQLVREGTIHNYLRMLWGKKILEWTPDPKTALKYLIQLNNKYSIDGRNPNSYSGIFWILGRFDRPWAPERKIFGSVRYMSSESTLRKIKLKEYLREFGDA